MHRQAARDRARLWREEQKRQLVAGYGGMCACCGEKRLEFLSIDHVNGGGTAHRKSFSGNTASLYRSVISRGFPPEFRVLCYNCNLSIGFRGYCPHGSEFVSI